MRKLLTILFISLSIQLSAQDQTPDGADSHITLTSSPEAVEPNLPPPSPETSDFSPLTAPTTKESELNGKDRELALKLKLGTIFAILIVVLTQVFRAFVTDNKFLNTLMPSILSILAWLALTLSGGTGLLTSDSIELLTFLLSGGLAGQVGRSWVKNSPLYPLIEKLLKLKKR